MNILHFILFSGRAGVGKTTSAVFVREHLTKLGYYGIILPIAMGVKETAISMGWDGNKDTKGRALLQAIGQAGRAYDADMWIKRAERLAIPHVAYVDSIDRDGPLYTNRRPIFILCDDWRFPNELEYLTSAGYNVTAIRIYAPSREILKDKPELYNETSETSLPDIYSPELYDIFINNDILSKEQLQSTLNTVVELIIEEQENTNECINC